MMLPLVVVGCTSKQSACCQSVREAAASGVDNAASPTDTAERDYFTLRERLITMQKQLEGTQSILMSSADRVAAHIDGQLMQLTMSNTHALPARSINA